MQNSISNELSRDKKGYIKLDDVLNLKRRTRYQKTGLPLEVAIHNALHILGLKDNPNRFDEGYADNQSTKERCRIDNYLVRETDTKVDIFPLEAKNHKDDSNLWSPSWMSEEIFDRSHKDRRLKNLIRRAEKAGKKVSIHNIVVCSYFKGSRQSGWLMNEIGWRKIELGFQVTKESFKKAVGILVRKFYWIKKNFFDKPIQKRLPSYNKSSLPMSSNRESNVISLINSSIRGLYSKYCRDMNECIPVKGYSFKGFG